MPKIKNMPEKYVNTYNVLMISAMALNCVRITVI